MEHVIRNKAEKGFKNNVSKSINILHIDFINKLNECFNVFI